MSRLQPPLTETSCESQKGDDSTKDNMKDWFPFLQERTGGILGEHFAGRCCTASQHLLFLKAAVVFSKPVAFRRQSLYSSFAQITILSYTWFPIRSASASLLHSSEWNSTCEWLEEARKQQFHCMLQNMRTFHLLLTSSLPSHLKMYSIIYISSASWIKGGWRHYFDRLHT